MSSYQRSLYWQRINDDYFTMGDGMLDGIFVIVHRTFLLHRYTHTYTLFMLEIYRVAVELM